MENNLLKISYIAEYLKQNNNVEHLDSLLKYFKTKYEIDLYYKNYILKIINCLDNLEQYILLFQKVDTKIIIKLFDKEKNNKLFFDYINYYIKNCLNNCNSVKWFQLNIFNNKNLFNRKLTYPIYLVFHLSDSEKIDISSLNIEEYYEGNSYIDSKLIDILFDEVDSYEKLYYCLKYFNKDSLYNIYLHIIKKINKLAVKEEQYYIKKSFDYILSLYNNHYSFIKFELNVLLIYLFLVEDIFNLNILFFIFQNIKEENLGRLKKIFRDYPPKIYCKLRQNIITGISFYSFKEKEKIYYNEKFNDDEEKKIDNKNEAGNNESNVIKNEIIKEKNILKFNISDIIDYLNNKKEKKNNIFFALEKILEVIYFDDLNISNLYNIRNILIKILCSPKYLYLHINKQNLFEKIKILFFIRKKPFIENFINNVNKYFEVALILDFSETINDRIFESILTIIPKEIFDLITFYYDSNPFNKRKVYFSSKMNKSDKISYDHLIMLLKEFYPFYKLEDFYIKIRTDDMEYNYRRNLNKFIDKLKCEFYNERRYKEIIIPLKKKFYMTYKICIDKIKKEIMSKDLDISYNLENILVLENMLKDNEIEMMMSKCLSEIKRIFLAHLDDFDDNHFDECLCEMKKFFFSIIIEKKNNIKFINRENKKEVSGEIPNIFQKIIANNLKEFVVYILEAIKYEFDEYYFEKFKIILMLKYEKNFSQAIFIFENIIKAIKFGKIKHTSEVEYFIYDIMKILQEIVYTFHISEIIYILIIIKSISGDDL